MKKQKTQLEQACDRLEKIRKSEKPATRLDMIYLMNLAAGYKK